MDGNKLINKLKDVNWSDIAKRAGKTFVQAFLSVISIDSLYTIKDINTAETVLIAMLISGFSAGICAVWNMIICMLKKVESEDG